MNPGLQAYFSAVYYFINSKFTLKVSVYEYFINLVSKLKNNPLKAAVHESFIE